MPVNEAYGEDLAYIHDAAYGDIARDAAERLIAELARGGHRNGLVVDLGCGPGVLAEHMTAAGYRVVGIDISEAMVARARERVPDAQFHLESFLSFEIPRCVSVTAIGEVLSYAFDPANDNPARATVFRRAFDALAPGGCLLFDIAGPGRAKRGAPHRTFAEGRDWAVLVESELNPVNGLLTRRITSFRQVGPLYRRSVETHRLSLLNPPEVLDTLRAVGFEPMSIASYGPAPLPEGVAAFLARKP